MIFRTIVLLAATAMAAVLTGCGGSSQDRSSHQDGSGSHEVSSPQQREATNTSSVVRCADNGSTVRQQEAHRGEVSNGNIAFTRSNTFQDASDIYVVDEEGAHETKLTYTKQFEEENPVWSPDGQKIAFTGGSSVGLPEDLYVINADGTNEAQLISRSDSIFGNSEDRTQVGPPVWSPDGNKIAFASRTVTDASASSSAESASADSASAPVEGLSGIYLINVDGTGLCKLEAAQGFGVLAWSPDGKKMFFSDLSAIYVINTDGSDRKELTSGTQFALSPDGQRIAFIDRSLELNVINADGSGLRRLTHSHGRSSVALPTWSPDSEKIAYSCPFEDPLHPRTDLCVINADGTGWKRIASKVVPVGFQVAASWGRKQR